MNPFKTSNMTSPKLPMAIPSGINDNYNVHAALMIPEIVEKFCNFCNYKDLKSCRLVCKQWLKAIAKLWSVRAHVRVQEIGTANDKPMSEYLKFARENVTENLVNFNINFGYRHSTFDSLVQFFELSGYHIQILKLDVSNCPNADLIRDILFKYCPNMTILSIDVTYPFKSPENAAGNIPNGYLGNSHIQENICKNIRQISISPELIINANISWMELFTNYPNLQGLQLMGLVTARHVDEIFTTINTIRKQDSKKLKLKDVYVWASWPYRINSVERIPPSFLQFLCNRNVQIQNFYLCTSTVNDISAIINILSTRESTFERLELRPDSVNDDEFISIKYKIRTLHRTSICKLGLLQPVLKFLACLKLMPNLRKLVLCQGSLNPHGSWFSRISYGENAAKFVHASLVELELYYYENAEEISKLIRWFPNVERLKISLSNETFELVCQGWPNLKFLNIHKSSVDECGITGLDGGQVIRINKAMGNICKRPYTVPRANITALKQLRSFHMNMYNRFRSPYSCLDFCSMVHGFQRTACPKDIFVKNYSLHLGLWKPVNEDEDDYYTLI